MAENLRYIHLLRTRKCLAALLVSELIDEDKMSKKKKRRGKTRAWIRRRSSKGCFNNIVKEFMIEDTAGYKEMMRISCLSSFRIFVPPATPSCKMFDMFKLPMDMLGTARTWAQHVERCCANALDFVEPHMDDRETKEMLSRVERKV